MKKLLKIFTLASLLIIPSAVYATDVDLSLSCDNKAKKNDTITCTVKANILDGNLRSISGNIDIDEKYFQSNSLTFDSSGEWETGQAVTLTTFYINTKSEIGTGKISISNLNGRNSDDEEVNFTNATASSEVKVLDNNSLLEDLKLDGMTVSGFNKQTKSYTQNFNKANVLISATAASSAKNIEGIGTKNLKCGKNTLAVVVTAEDDTKTTYTLNLNRTCNADTTLKMITLSSGKLDPTFSSNETSYTVNVSTDIDKITIATNKNNQTQTVSGEVKDAILKYGDNVFKIIVTAENGDKKTYTIKVVREDGRNTNNNLQELTIKEAKLDFDPNTTSYKTKVLNDVTNLTINAIAEAKTSKIEITGDKNLKVGENTVIIKVTSEKEEVKEYKIIVTRLKEGETLGDNPNIKEIRIEGYDIDFDPNKTSYSLKIKDEDVLQIKVTMEDPTSSYTIDGNKSLKNKSVITINTKSEDGTTKVYTIAIEKDNFTLIIILAVLISLTCVGLIIYLIIKNKKNKPKDDKKVTTTIVKDKDLMDKVNRQLKEVEQKNKILEHENIIKNADEKPLNDETIDLTKEYDLDSEYDIDPSQIIDLKSINEANERENEKEQEEKNDNSYERNITRFTANIRYNNEEDDEDSEEELRPRRVSYHSGDGVEPTKICTICGHRVPESAKTCPYCKRTW